MKLTAATCPSCGASLQVNSKEETTVCNYCNSTIFIEDAVEKYKLELSGTVKISGIKDNQDRLSDARNYLRLKEYGNANDVLSVIIREEPFNIEAYILRIKSYTSQFSEIYDDDEFKTDPALNQGFWKDVDLVLNTYQRLQDVDEKGTYKSKLKDEIAYVEKMQKEREQAEIDIDICEDIGDIIEEITSYKFTPEIAKATNRNYKKVNKVVLDYFFNTLGLQIMKVPDEVRCVYRDMTIKYYDANSNFRTETITKIGSLNGVEKALKDTRQKAIDDIKKSANSGLNPIGMIKNLINK